VFAFIKGVCSGFIGYLIILMTFSVLPINWAMNQEYVLALSCDNSETVRGRMSVSINH